MKHAGIYLAVAAIAAAQLGIAVPPPEIPPDVRRRSLFSLCPRHGPNTKVSTDTIVQ